MGVIVKGGVRLNVEDRVITTLEATNQELTLELKPREADQVVLYFPNGSVQVYNLDYIVSGQVLQWSGYSLETLIESGDRVKISYPI